jgi:hypothetical protein
MIGPIEVLMKVYAKTDDGKIGSFNVTLPAGTLPTRDTLATLLEEARKDMPPGYREISKREFWSHMCMKTCGEVFEMEGSAEWEAA